MTRINTNIASLQAINRLSVNQADLAVRLERLATGLRINRGRDDPAGLIASEIMRAEIRSTQQAIANSHRVNNVLSTAEGALSEVSALLLELQALIVEAANDAGLTEEEISANQLQLDSILDSIDRIGNTTKFGGKKLLDGGLAYIVSSVQPTALASVQLFSAQLPRTGARRVDVTVTASARTAQLSLTGTTTSGISRVSATTIEVRGNIGVQLLSFASGTTLAVVRDTINGTVGTTGVSAIVVAGSGGTASALQLNSTSVGSAAFVAVSPILGNFVEAGNTGTDFEARGVDPTVLINGQPASTKGLRADVRSNGLDLRLYLSRTFGETLSSSTFYVTGGGALFQLTPEVTPNGQLFVGFNRIAATTLGNSVTGLLQTIRSGQPNDLRSKNFLTAQEILAEAIDQVAVYRGRLGNIQKNHIDPNIAAQNIAVENVTAAESIIRDADMATEISAMTRAQILIQSTQSTLQIANSIPNLVLSLLG